MGDLEEQILAECRELDFRLDDLKAFLLRGKLDFSRCMVLRDRQLARWLGDPGAIGDARCGWLDEPGQVERIRREVGGSEPAEQRKVVEYLGDLWACFRWRGDRFRASQVRDLVRQIFANAQDRAGADRDPNVNSMRVRTLRHEADHELIGISPWDLKGASLLTILLSEARCRNAVQLCDEALKTIEWATDRDYARNKSYFHSLSGRARYILGEFHEAHREIDLAQFGLTARGGADREALAASLLRLAECLIVRADDVILRCCIDSQPEGWVPSLDDLSAAGRRSLLDLEGKEASPPGYEDLAARLTVMLAEQQAGSLGDNLLRFLKRCLSNWSPAALAMAPQPDSAELEVAVARSQGRLLRAQSVLDRAESMLIGARQNLEWWVCLYQLRAQIQIEFLLTQITSPVNLKKDRRTFIARFVRSLQEGLRAIRQGLDILLPGKVGQLEDVRVKRCLRMWIALLLCGGYLMRVTRPDMSEDTLWKRWAILNSTTRLRAFLGARRFFIQDPLANIARYDTGLQARSDVLTAVETCLRNGGVAALAEAFAKSLASERPQVRRHPHLDRL